MEGCCELMQHNECCELVSVSQSSLVERASVFISEFKHMCYFDLYSHSTTHHDHVVVKTRQRTQRPKLPNL